jgi:hypothetical protein
MTTARRLASARSAASIDCRSGCCDTRQPAQRGPCTLVLASEGCLSVRFRVLRHLRRAAADAVGVRPVAITGADPNAGMDREPVGHHIGSAHREHIDDAAPLHIHEDRAEMLLAPLRGPVIDAHDTQALVDIGWRGATFDDAQTVSALTTMFRRAKQAFAGAPTNAGSTRWTDDAHPERVLAARRRDLWQSFADDDRRALGIPAAPPTDRTRNVTDCPCAVKSSSCASRGYGGPLTFGDSLDSDHTIVPPLR